MALKVGIVGFRGIAVPHADSHQADPLADLVANPGCYPTSVLLPLVPLLKAGLVDAHDIIVDSKSGVSGAGRALSLKTHICESGESFSAYKVGRAHRHIPEIEQELSRAAGSGVTIEFTPHLIPISRGMLSTIYVTTSTDDTELGKCLKSFYAGSPFVHIIDGQPSTKDVRGTNRCLMNVTKNRNSRRATLVSAIDNLTKGASGQAVQCMNLMFGLDEARDFARRLLRRGRSEDAAPPAGTDPV